MILFRPFKMLWMQLSPALSLVLLRWLALGRLQFTDLGRPLFTALGRPLFMALGLLRERPRLIWVPMPSNKVRPPTTPSRRALSKEMMMEARILLSMWLHQLPGLQPSSRALSNKMTMVAPILLSLWLDLLPPEHQLLPFLLTLLPKQLNHSPR